MWRQQWYLLPWTVVRIKECALCLCKMLSLENVQSTDLQSAVQSIACRPQWSAMPILSILLMTDCLLIYVLLWIIPPFECEPPLGCCYTVWCMGTYVHKRVLKVVYWWPLAAEGDWWESGFRSHSLLLSPILVSPASGWLQSLGLFPPIYYGLLALLNAATLF